MKKSTKAALLSGLVFPGIGHFFLKKRIPGILLSGTALISLYFLIAESVAAALKIKEKIRSGEIDLSTTTITELAAMQTAADDSQLLGIATTALIICWLVGIVDSYRVGRANDD